MITQAQVAKAFSTSPNNVSGWHRDGMPLDSLDIAGAWIEANTRCGDNVTAWRTARFVAGEKLAAAPGDTSWESMIARIRDAEVLAYQAVEAAPAGWDKQQALKDHAKAVGNRLDYEERATKQALLERRLLTPDQAQEVVRVALGIVAQKIRTQAARLAVRVNPADPAHARAVLEEDGEEMLRSSQVEIARAGTVE
jgi:hypothetical protein